MRPTATSAPKELEQIAQKLFETKKPIAIMAHVDPDGDALGSCLGLERALRSIGKHATTYMNCPRYLRFLLEEDTLNAPTEFLSEDHLLVVLDVDASDPRRVEGISTEAFSGEVINIDHHGTNQRTTPICWVNPEKAACTQMVAELIEHMEIPFTPSIAHPLLLGMITDTGSFRFSNTDSSVLKRAAQLLEAGANLSWINEHLSQTPAASFRLQAQMLASIEYLFDGRVILAKVNSEMVTSAGATWEEVESMISVIRSAEGTELAALFKDFGDTVKLSLRSRGALNAQRIAIACGGGGHTAAAGALLEMDYANARAQFERAVLAEINR
ncbi:MAG: bifunctional oligoribonuclease/PAP phosphatase NrnA [Deinococcaceae bacterium]